MAKILLVEDDKSLREIYGVRLMAEGYEIVSAGDGEEALAVAIKERPNLIVSDVMMPKISGFDMLDILRSTTETKDIKVIMMTALSSEDQRARGEALGADRYLVKSQVGIEDVVRTVHDVMGDGIPANAGAPVFPTAPAPVDPAPIAEPTPAPAPIAPEPHVPPAPIAAPVEPAAPAVAPIPYASAEPLPAPTPVVAPAYEAPVINTPPAPAPYVAPVAAPTAPIAPVEAPVQPLAPAPVAPEPYVPPAPAYEAPAPIAPAPIAEPAPAPYTPPAPIAPAAPVEPAPSTLPAPTAPFSSPRPASLGDRVINPLPSADSLNAGVADVATQMNAELNAQIQELQPQPAPAAIPQPPAPYTPPAPQPPLPPQPTA